MKSTLVPGSTYTRRIAVDKARTIGFMGDDLRVYSTPSMVQDVEYTCKELLDQHHDQGESSVGARVEIDHLGATLLGQEVEVKATVTSIEGRRVLFDVEVHDGLDKVGASKHTRFIVTLDKQAERLAAKRARLKGA
ncbi:MAG: thioesterase family protein [Alphaproteobacteria bacterium]